MSLKEIFKMPNPVTITGRSSSITNSFVNGIVPCIIPSDDEIREALSILGMDENTICCAYCGDKLTEWDHLRPLVKGRMPTGYISEIYNLVPACGKCNQSKGNSNWKEWMLGKADLSPKRRQIPNLDEKISRLEKYERWKDVQPIDFEAIVGKELWEEHWKNWSALISSMREAQHHAEKIKQMIKMR